MRQPMVGATELQSPESSAKQCWLLIDLLSLGKCPYPTSSSNLAGFGAPHLYDCFVSPGLGKCFTV